MFKLNSFKYLNTKLVDLDVEVPSFITQSLTVGEFIDKVQSDALEYDYLIFRSMDDWWEEYLPAIIKYIIAKSGIDYIIKSIVKDDLDMLEFEAVRCWIHNTQVSLNKKGIINYNGEREAGSKRK